MLSSVQESKALGCKFPQRYQLPLWHIGDFYSDFILECRFVISVKKGNFANENRSVMNLNNEEFYYNYR